MRRIWTIESLRDESAQPKPTTTSSLRPAPASRQKSEPPAIPKPRSQSAVQDTSPKLTRTATAPPTTKPASTLALKAPALVTGGLVGCVAGAAVLLGTHLWHDFAGAESALLAAKSARLSMDALTDELIASLHSGTYSADEALDTLRRTTLAYASTIPDGAPFVERVFREIATVRRQRGREVDRVVAATHAELARAARRGAGDVEMRDVVLRQLVQLSGFAGRATRDVVARNPGLRPWRDEAVKSLQGPRETGVPTVRVNMAVRQKQTIRR